MSGEIARDRLSVFVSHAGFADERDQSYMRRGLMRFHAVDRDDHQLIQAQYDATLSLHVELAKGAPEARRGQRKLALVLTEIAHLECHLNLRAAVLHSGQALAILTSLADAQPENQQAQRELAIALNNHARLEREFDPEAAAMRLASALAILRALAAGQPDDQRALTDLAIAEENLARLELHLVLGRAPETVSTPRGGWGRNLNVEYSQYQVDIGRLKSLVDYLGLAIQYSGILASEAMRSPLLDAGMRERLLQGIVTQRQKMLHEVEQVEADANLLEVEFRLAAADYLIRGPLSMSADSLPRPLGPRADRLQFSASYPGVLQLHANAVLVIHVFIPDLREESQRRLRRISNLFRDYPTQNMVTAPLLTPRSSVLEIRPIISGVRVRPATQHVIWNGELEEVQFTIAATQAATLTGAVEVTMGDVLVGQIPVSFIVEPKGTPVGQVVSTEAGQFERVFASYARVDKSIVHGVAASYIAAGIDYFIDNESLRGGERWTRGLEEAITNADMFQLFWSNASATSRWVETEWRYALYNVAPRRPIGARFVRPIYWRKPMPAPPAPLAQLHFGFLPITE